MKSARVNLAPPSPQQRLAERQRPDGPVVMFQRWEHLLFLHWKWDPEAVQLSLPPGLRVDTFDGAAYLGVVPLFLRNVRPRGLPAVPAISDFPELNLRTYVYDSAGRPGVYFYSLDCDQPLAVEAAKRLFHLRYEHAAIKAEVGGDGWVDFESQRDGTVLTDQFRYTGFGPAGEPYPESLEFFLVERYRLYSSDEAGEQMTSVRLSHPPYIVRQAQVTKFSDAVLRYAKFDTGGRAPDHICYSAGVDVEIFTPEKVE